MTDADIPTMRELVSEDMVFTHMSGNQPIVELLKDFAKIKNATPVQIFLAWTLHKYPNVVPIAGTEAQNNRISFIDCSHFQIKITSYRVA